MDVKKYKKEYYQKNKVKILKQMKKKYNPKKKKSYNSKYYNNNKELYKQQSKEWKKRNPEKVKLTNRKYLLKKFGITIEEFEILLQKQNNRCWICREKPQKNINLTVDHCHTTKKIRGLLCRNCNLALGNFKNSIVHLKQAIKYLRKFQKKKQKCIWCGEKKLINKSGYCRSCQQDITNGYFD